MITLLPASGGAHVTIVYSLGGGGFKYCVKQHVVIWRGTGREFRWLEG
jgi:hypothetical protein